MTAQNTDGLLSTVRLGVGAMPFLGEHATSNRHQGQEIFGQYRQVSNRAGDRPIILFTVFAAQSQFFGPGLDECDIFQAEGLDDMAAKIQFLTDRIDQGELNARVEYLERDAGKACPGSDIDQPLGDFASPGEQAGERIEEMFGADAFHIPNGSQVKAGIPIQQLLFVELKGVDLPGRQLDPHQRTSFFDQLLHVAGIIPEMIGEVEADLYSSATPGFLWLNKSMHRFFIPLEVFETEQISFPAETAHQMARVLRLQAGEQVVVLDGSGREALVELTLVERESVEGRVCKRYKNQAEPLVTLRLFIGLTQREKFEWILQKGTEVGVTTFIPVITQRSLVQTAGQKMDRWQRIVKEAAEQSGRGIVPKVLPAVPFETAAGQAGQFDLSLAAWEQEKSLALTTALAGARAGGRLALLIGPEGGLSVEEIEMARACGWQPVSLGPRILRMETAAVVAAALIAAHFESRSKDN